MMNDLESEKLPCLNLGEKCVDEWCVGKSSMYFFDHRPTNNLVDAGTKFNESDRI